MNDVNIFRSSRVLIEIAEKISVCVARAHAEELVSSHRIAIAGSEFCADFKASCDTFRKQLSKEFPQQNHLLKLGNEDLYTTLILPLAHTYHNR